MEKKIVNRRIKLQELTLKNSTNENIEEYTANRKEKRQEKNGIWQFYINI